MSLTSPSTPDRAGLQETARALAEAYPFIEAVYLFGSRARGTSRPRSDVDVAVLLDSTFPDQDRFDLQPEFGRFLEERFEVPVDVVVIGPQLRPELLFGIFSTEIILYARNWERAHHAACRARAEYRDELPRLERGFAQVCRQIEERAGVLNRS